MPTYPAPSDPAPSRVDGPVCGVCSQPSEGEVCSACDAPVCTNHKNARDGFCERCATDFEEASGALGAGLALKLGLGAAFVSLLLGTLFGALQSGAAGSAPGTLRLLVAPLVALALSAALLVVGQRWIVRRRFLKQRRPNRTTLPSPAMRPAKPDDFGIARVLTIPPSAYDKLPLLRALPPDVMAQASREALLGSSRPPDSAGPLTEASPRLIVEPIGIAESAAGLRLELGAALQPIQLEVPPLETLRAIEPRPEFNGARTPRRGPRRDRVHRRRAR